MAERILITGARAAAALDMARDFAAAGYEVHLADCSPARMARCSHAVAGVHHYASPVADRAGFRRDIAALVAKLDPTRVIPSCEEVFHLAAPALDSVLQDRLFAPSLATLRRLHDKHAFAMACDQWGLPVPESVLVDSPQDLPRFAAESTQWVFKPPFSRFGESALIGLSPPEVNRLAPSPEKPLLAQRRICGDESCFHAVSHRGVVVAFAAYRSQWRLGGGASFAFAPLPTAEAARLRDLAERLAQGAQITGQFACDVMVDDNGQPWLLECNPRATSGVHLLSGSGDLARAIMDGTAMPENISHGPRHLGPAMLFFGLPLALRSGRMAQWRAAMRKGTDVISRSGDRLPLAGALLDAAGFTLAGLRHGISTTSATTSDIAWNGEDLA